MTHTSSRTTFLFLTESEILTGLATGNELLPPLPIGTRLGMETVYPIPELESWLYHHGLDDSFLPPDVYAVSVIAQLESARAAHFAFTARECHALRQAAAIEHAPASLLIARIADASGIADFLEWGGFFASDPAEHRPRGA